MAENKKGKMSGSVGRPKGSTAAKGSRGGTAKAKSSGKNQSSQKKQGKTGSSKANVPEKKDNGLRKEIKILLMAGTAILLFAFIISGSGDNAGIVGEVSNKLLKGVFGVGAWIMPVALLGGAVYLFKEKNDVVFKMRAVFSTLLFVATIAFITGFSGAEQYEGLSFFPFVAYAFNHGSNINGGLLGSMVYVGLYKLVGGVGTYIVLTLLILILIMLISGGSLVGIVRNAAENVKNKYNEYYDYEDDYDEDYVDFPDYDDFEPQEAEQSIFEPEVMETGGGAKRAAVFEIKKGNKEKHKISLMTDDFKSTGDNSEVEGRGRGKHIRDDDITGILSLFTKEETTDFNPPSFMENKTEEQERQNEEEPVFEEEISADASSFESPESVAVMAEAVEKAKKRTHKAAAEKTEDEDNPPWDDAYADGEEPEIIKADEEKLVDKLETEKKAAYRFPKLEFLGVNKSKSREKSREEILQKARKLEETLAIFKVEAKVNNISIGPTVTRYELTPSVGTKVSAITNLENDIKFSMAAESIIIEAPIPGKSAIGIEIPNDTRESVYFSEVLRSERFQKMKSKIAFGLGEDITGSVTVADLAKMPHLLVAGTTGSGKSVCINTIIMSILYKATPDEVKMIMVDPKMVELSVYNGIPHLLLPVVTEPEKAAGALNWAVIEMERRYKMLAQTGTRNIEGYNQRVPEEEKLSQIVIIIDELADLMMVVGKEIETSICRLAQKARAAGMHLVLATQRPSADVLTGLIRSNVPSRIAFKVSGSMDSRIILDSTGAEKLLGKGDMLFKTADMPKPVRIQGAFITDDEVERVVSYISPQEPCYDENIIKEIESAGSAVASGNEGFSGDSDTLTDEVLEWIVANPKGASAGKVQRHFRIGFNRASRIIEELEDRGILGPTNGSQPREVLMDRYELKERKERYEDL